MNAGCPCRRGRDDSLREVPRPRDQGPHRDGGEEPLRPQPGRAGRDRGGLDGQRGLGHVGRSALHPRAGRPRAARVRRDPHHERGERLRGRLLGVSRRLAGRGRRRLRRCAGDRCREDLRPQEREPRREAEGLQLLPGRHRRRGHDQADRADEGRRGAQAQGARGRRPTREGEGRRRPQPLHGHLLDGSPRARQALRLDPGTAGDDRRQEPLPRLPQPRCPVPDDDDRGGGAERQARLPPAHARDVRADGRRCSGGDPRVGGVPEDPEGRATGQGSSCRGST